MHRVAVALRIAVLTALPLLLSAAPAWAHGGGGGEPAGGTPVEDLIPAAVVGVVLIAALAGFGWLHRSGRTTLLTRAGAFSERIGGLPAWAALPVGVAGVSLLVAVFGFYWDVGTHIDNGRDPGPFANPSHWFILIGLLGIALAGVLAMLLGSEEEHPTSLRLRDDWHVPVGGVLLTLCGVIAVLGFPLDDVWHRIFGQDVTLWSPTHIQMVGGASLSTLALWVLVSEGRRTPRPVEHRERGVRVRNIAIAGAFLIGASTVQAEFDYAVPQFRLLYQPVLLMIAAGMALVPARIRFGRGGALAAVGMFLAIRVTLTVLVTPILGHTTLHFPLYLGAAIAVELVAWRYPTRRQVQFGALAGLGIGTLGLASEWAWSHIGLPIPWTGALLPEGVIVPLVAAVAAGTVGGLIGRALVPREPRQSVGTWVPAVAGLAILATLLYPLRITEIPGAAAEVTLEDAEAGEERTVHATIHLEPKDLAEGAEFLNVTAWQGSDWGADQTAFLDPLERVEEGVYRTTRPIPVHGGWKALLRLHRDTAIVAVPIFMPEDPAIPAEEIPAEASFTRDFEPDRALLMRESKETQTWITAGAHAALIALIIAWIAAVGWGLSRVRRTAPDLPEGGGPPARTVPDRARSA